ncbi:MAG: D-serine deaminase-like pyridoxal phosphate-dependent protein [Myxococcota bacterium]|jgi:D-serine deaminase-like pyridoxal phosphate-dependent protein
MTPDDRWLEWRRFRSALAGRELPCAVVDLDALEANLATMLARVSPGLRLRIATKSVRVPALLAHVARIGGERIGGWLAYSSAEAELLVAEGLDDILVAYPVISRPEAARIARLNAGGSRVVAMVDCAAHVDALADAATEVDAVVPVCIDIDVSLRPVPGLHLGVRRSPIRTASAARRLAGIIAEAPAVELVGVMAYEAQVAGLPDQHSTPVHTRAVQWIKTRSVSLAARRRAEVVQALRSDGHTLTFVNGGGTGSLRTTSADPSVTEIAAGSGLYAPHLFDGYTDLPLIPAAFFALQIVRQPDPRVVTCAGGGYIASGGAGPDRLPVVYAPDGLAPLAMEGFGEVQTPLRWTGRGLPPTIGMPVICRHAKAGELMERFDRVLWLRGDHIVDETATYRGLGGCYL